MIFIGYGSSKRDDISTEICRKLFFNFCCTHKRLHNESYDNLQNVHVHKAALKWRAK